jgi:hypothetical protein
MACHRRLVLPALPADRAETVCLLAAPPPSRQVILSLIKTVTFDCADALVAARFWAATLGSDGDEESTASRAHVEAAGGAGFTAVGGGTCGHSGGVRPTSPAR